MRYFFISYYYKTTTGGIGHGDTTLENPVFPTRERMVEAAILGPTIIKKENVTIINFIEFSEKDYKNYKPIIL